MSEVIQEIFVDRIDDPKHAMRSDIRDESLFLLADNIKQNELINPITVRPVGDRFEVVAGHRRFAAVKINGAIKIACCVRELSDKETFSVMAAENLERKDVDVIDESTFIMQYMEQTGDDSKATAVALRRSKKYVEDRIAIAEMPDYIRQYLKEGKIKLGVALALNQITNDRLKESWIHNAVANGISVATAEYQLQDYITNKPMYDGVVAAAQDNEINVTPKPVMFRCAFSNREYDARLMKPVFIYEEYVPLIAELGLNWFKVEAQNPTPPTGD